MFFERLLQLCKEENTSVTNMLKAMNFSTYNGTLWRNGRLPKGETLIALATHFHVSVDYLLGLTNRKMPHEVGEPANPLDDRLIGLIGQLAPEQKQFLIAQIKTLLQGK